MDRTCEKCVSWKCVGKSENRGGRTWQAEKTFKKHFMRWASHMRIKVIADERLIQPERRYEQCDQNLLNFDSGNL